MTATRYFEPGGVYHIYNRGVEKRDIFLDATDYRRFLNTLVFYQQQRPEVKFSLTHFRTEERKEPLHFDIITYCLMPNHFHLMVRLRSDGEISTSIGQLQNSYTRYFNIRYDRSGYLFQGRFKAVPILTDEQFVHLARYIILNPYAAGLVELAEIYEWSSYREYLGLTAGFCHRQLLQDYFTDQHSLTQFISDYQEYARSLEIIKHGRT